MPKTKQQGSAPARNPFALQLEQMHECIVRLAGQTRVVETADPATVKDAVGRIGETVAELEMLDGELRSRGEELAAADVALEDERRRYKELFEFGPDGYLLTDLLGTVREGNRFAARLLHTSPALLVGKNLAHYIAGDGRAAFEAQLARLRFGEAVLEWETRLRVRAARPSFVSLSASAVRSVDGRLTDLHWVIRDINDRKQTEEQLRLLVTELERQIRVTTEHPDSPDVSRLDRRTHDTPERRLLRDLVAAKDLSTDRLDCMISAVAVLDVDGNIVDVNRGWSAGADDNFLVAASSGQRGRNYPDDCARAAADGGREALALAEGIRRVARDDSTTCEFEFEGRAGSDSRWFAVTAARVETPQGARVVVAHEDITERKLVELRIETYLTEIKRYSSELEQANTMLSALATTDGLTNVKNHRALQQQINVEFYRARRYNTALSVVLIDIDHFKKYNDTYGHPAGNDVLCMVARALQANARHADFVARYGGDEFVVVLPEAGITGSMEAAERMRAAVLNDGLLHRQVTVSIGVATLHQDMVGAGALLEEADRALYESKGRGRNCVVHLRSGRLSHL